MLASVSAEALRPTGPAAAEASPPILTLLLENVRGGGRAHEQEDEICGLATQLKSEARAFKSHHGRRAPGTAKVRATAASHHATTVAATHDKGCLQDGRQHHHTIRLIDYALRNVIGNVHDFGNYSSRGLYSIRFLVLPKTGRTIRPIRLSATTVLLMLSP